MLSTSSIRLALFLTVLPYKWMKVSSNEIQHVNKISSHWNMTLVQLTNIATGVKRTRRKITGLLTGEGGTDNVANINVKVKGQSSHICSYWPKFRFSLYSQHFPLWIATSRCFYFVYYSFQVIVVIVILQYKLCFHLKCLIIVYRIYHIMWSHKELLMLKSSKCWRSSVDQAASKEGNGQTRFIPSSDAVWPTESLHNSFLWYNVTEFLTEMSVHYLPYFLQ